MEKASLSTGKSRYQCVFNSLKLIEGAIKDKLAGKQKICVKINLVDSNNINNGTHPEAVRAVVDTIRRHTDQEIDIIEAPFRHQINRPLENFGYYKALSGRRLRFIDLNEQETEQAVFSHPRFNRPVKLNLSKITLSSDFLISVAPPKTHDRFMVTLGLKNVAVGSTIAPNIFGSYIRHMFHKNIVLDNILLAEVAARTMPDLNVIDGWIGIEGDGPVHGTPVDWGIAVSSLDSLLADMLSAGLMGFNPDEVGYLYLLNQKRKQKIDLRRIEVVGEKDWKKHRKFFKRHKSIEKQERWKK